MKHARGMPTFGSFSSPKDEDVTQAARNTGARKVLHTEIHQISAMLIERIAQDAHAVLRNVQ